MQQMSNRRAVICGRVDWIITPIEGAVLRQRQQGANLGRLPLAFLDGCFLKADLSSRVRADDDTLAVDAGGLAGGFWHAGLLMV